MRVEEKLRSVGNLGSIGTILKLLKLLKLLNKLLKLPKLPLFPIFFLPLSPIKSLNRAIHCSRFAPTQKNNKKKRSPFELLFSYPEPGSNRHRGEPIGV